MLLRVGEGVVGGGGVLHAAGLAAAADLDLRLDHDRLADFLGDRLGVLGAMSVTRPGVVGTLCLANSSFAWYSKRSMWLTVWSV